MCTGQIQPDPIARSGNHASRGSVWPRKPIMQHSQFALLGQRRFAPFFWTQFFGAGNDNVLKLTVVVS